MVQLLSYIPLINGVIPYNLEIFLRDYLSVGSIVIPLRLLPLGDFNPLSWVASFATNPFNDRFQLFGYESVSFIWNFVEQLTTWFVVLLIYLVLRVLCRVLPENRHYAIGLQNL